MLRPYLSLPRDVYLLSVGALLSRAGTVVVPFLTLYVQTERGGSATFSTAVLGAYGGGAVIASLFGGVATDRVGRRAVMVASIASSIVALLALRVSTSPAALIASTFAFGMFNEMFRPASAAMLTDVVAPQARVHAFGAYYLAINLGLSLAPLLGGALAARSFAWLFWFNAGTSAAFAVFLWIGLSDRRHVSGPKAVRFRAAAGRVLGDRVFMLFVAASFLLGLVFMQHLGTLPLAMRQAGMTPKEIGVVLAINGVLITVSQVPITSVMARSRRGLMIPVSALVIGLGFGLHTLAGTPLQFAIGVIVWTLGECAIVPLQQAVIGDLAPEALRGSYIGMWMTSFMGSLFIGGPLGGALVDYAGSASLWVGCFALSSVSAALYFSLRRSLDAKA